MSIIAKDWPHAPVHRFGERGAYMVTAGTYGKIHYLNTPQRRDDFLRYLFFFANQLGWELQAWAVMSNHYHIIALSPQNAGNLSEMISRLHHESTTALNAADNKQNRRVWYQYWDTFLTYRKSYLARLHYTHNNPVYHGLVADAEEYPWCSMAWFRQYAESSFRRRIESFRIDAVKVFDDF